MTDGVPRWQPAALPDIRAVLRLASGAVVVATGVAGLATLLATVQGGVRAGALAEAQRAADAGALAGAGTLLLVPDRESLARQEAISFARRNPVRGGPPEVSESDVVIDGARGTVTVRVGATVYPLAEHLAWLPGARPVRVSATATAEARSASRGLPLKRLQLVR